MFAETSDPDLYDRGVYHRFGVSGEKRKLDLGAVAVFEWQRGKNESGADSKGFDN